MPKDSLSPRKMGIMIVHRGRQLLWRGRGPEGTEGGGARLGGPVTAHPPGAAGAAHLLIGRVQKKRGSEAALFRAALAFTGTV